MLPNNKFLPYLACLCSGLFSFYSLFQFSLFNILSPDLITSFQLTHAQLGLFSAVFLLVNTLWLIPGGCLLDKYSARPVVLLFVLLNALSCFVLATSHWLPLSVAMRAIQGMASAMSVLTYARIAPHWFPHKPATALGLVGVCASLGGIFANTVFVKWVTVLGWRHALMIDGLIGILFFIMMWFFLYERDNAQVKAEHKQKLMLADIKLALSNLQNTVFGLYIGFMTLPVFLLASLWGMLYLMHVWQLSSNAASQICALIFIGGMLGEPSFGFVSDRFNNRKAVMLSGTLLALICILILLLFKGMSVTWLTILFFGIGFFSSAQMVCYILIRKTNPLYRVSTVTSYTCLIMNIVGMLAQPISGFIIGAHKTAVGYQHVLAAIAVSFVICLLLGLFMRGKVAYVNN